MMFLGSGQPMMVNPQQTTFTTGALAGVVYVQQPNPMLGKNSD